MTPERAADSAAECEALLELAPPFGEVSAEGFIPGASPPLRRCSLPWKALVVAGSFAAATVVAAGAWRHQPRLPLQADTAAAVQEEAIESWFCSNVENKIVASAEEYCCEVNAFVHHCAVVLTFDGTEETAFLEWFGAVGCKSYPRGDFLATDDAKTGVVVGCGSSFWSSQADKTAQRSMALLDVKKRSQRENYNNCQFFARDIYNYVTGARTDLEQGILARLAGGISSSSASSSRAVVHSSAK